MHVPQPFAQLVGSGEAEVTDLIQVLDAHVAARAAHDQQRADRFDITIGGLRDPRRPTRQRGAGRFDRVELVGLAVAAPLLSVGTIDLDHHQAPAAQMTRQAGTIRAGAFHPDPIHGTEAGKPTVQLGVAGRCRRERARQPSTPPFVSTAAATCTSACVSTPPVTGRVVSTMVIAIPSLSNGQGVARTSREGDRDEQLRQQRLDTLRNGACPSRARSPADMHPPNTSVHPTSQTDPRATPNVATTTNTMVDPRTSAHPYSLGNMRSCIPIETSRPMRGARHCGLNASCCSVGAPKT